MNSLQNKFLLCAVWALWALLPSASAASFDCAKARTRIEHQICNNLVLSQLDDQMAVLYAEARAAANRQSAKDGRDLVENQREWLNDDTSHFNLASCKDVKCTEKYIRDRIQFLKYFCAQTALDRLALFPVEGHYVGSHQELEVKSRSGRISVHLEAFWVSPTRQPGAVNTGQLEAEMALDGQKAIYKDLQELDCQVVITFFHAKAVVEQTGSCGMGMNVNASGVYLKQPSQEATALSLPEDSVASSIKRMPFQPGNSLARESGTVQRYEARDYLVSVRAGQTITVKLSSPNTYLVFDVFRDEEPVIIEADREWSGQAAKSGDYKVRVFLMRAAARRGAAANYTLTVSMK
jgi:hypothetical protein